MSMLHRQPHMLALLLLVLFIVAVAIFVILSSAGQNNVWHIFLSFGPDIVYPHP